MISVAYFEHNGTRHDVAATIGMTVMEAAVKNDVPGITADCGGALACATCHVYISEQWRAATGDPSPDELEMLECSNDVLPNSRLSCQIALSEALDGLRVDLPLSQS